MSLDCQILQYKDLRLDLRSKRCLIHHNVFYPNAKEFKLLELLLEYSERVVPHRKIILSVWGLDNFGIGPNNVMTLVSMLRKRLGPYGKQYIKTVSKRGYTINDN